jgi:putative inorganic carbon (HCO3(-)) transporter
VAGLSSAQADFKVEALRELRMVIVEPAILFLMLRSQKLTRAAIWRITDGFVLGAVLIALIGLVNYARGNVFPAEFGLPRIRSVYGSSNNDALFLSRAFPLLLAVMLFGRWPAREIVTTANGMLGRLRNNRFVQLVISRRLLYATGLIAVSVAILLSQSRGSLLFGVPAAVIVVCLVGGGRWRYMGIALLALLAVVMGILLSGVAAPLLANTRFANALDLTRGTGFFRFNLWQSAIAMWRDHPILGVGPDNFLYAYRGYYIQPAAWQEPNLSHPHNIVFDFATRLGTLGLVAGAGMAVGVWRSLRRAWIYDTERVFRPLIIGCAGIFAALLAHGMVDHSLFLVDLSFAFMLAAGLLSHLAMPAVAHHGEIAHQ